MKIRYLNLAAAIFCVLIGLLLVGDFVADGQTHHLVIALLDFALAGVNYAWYRLGMVTR